VQKEMNGVGGLAVDVTRIEAGYKLSQNRGDEDHAYIIRKLEKRGDDDSKKVVEEMRQNRR
jgi:predicted FMN-binding regulatory protein PaiB